MTSARAAGDSGEQRSAEAEMLAGFAARLGVTLAGKTYPIPGGAKLQIDGVSESPPILCEACAHQGSPKAGQKRKIIADAFKLVYADQLLGRTFRKVILLADEDAAAAFYGDLSGGEYGLNAERLIAVGRKPERDPGARARPNHGMQPTAFGRG